MGKVTFTKLQESLFTQITTHKNFPKTFYFTGGTALSAFHLHHRVSDDLDFFSEDPFDQNILLDIIKDISLTMKTAYRYTQRERINIFEFVNDKNELLIKIDFVHHPYKRLEKGTQATHIEIDSLLDIATNKLLTINQRTEVKDFVDLYFLLQKFTFWDLIYALKAKYNMEIDIILLATDCMKVESFTFMPLMHDPLSLKTLQGFFRQQAKKLGKMVVTK
ncbi:MAG: hypothetical protein HW400_288 [Candidatus Levybacteria bacterium]|nr:hypothetical protein [Candidatus Levybacteria bacterium]